MKILDISFVNLLKRANTVYSKQHQAIAENVANADNPLYLRKNTDFSHLLKEIDENSLTTSNARHVSESIAPSIPVNEEREGVVDIHREMGELAINQIHFDFSTRILRRTYDQLRAGITGRTR